MVNKITAIGFLVIVVIVAGYIEYRIDLWKIKTFGCHCEHKGERHGK